MQTPAPEFLHRLTCRAARLLRAVAPILLVWFASTARAQSVDVQQAWARPTVPGQTATGLFMTLKAPTDMRLMSASSPVATGGEVHEMRMDNDVMRMRALDDGLALPAGQRVELTPGGYHIMLMGLKAPLRKGTNIDVFLVFRDAQGKESKAEVIVPIRLTPANPAPH